LEIKIQKKNQNSIPNKKSTIQKIKICYEKKFRNIFKKGNSECIFICTTFKDIFNLFIKKLDVVGIPMLNMDNFIKKKFSMKLAT